MDRTCPVENCSLINRAMKLLYTSIAALDIYIKIGTERSIFIFSLPFLFNKNVRCNFSPSTREKSKLHSPMKLL